MDPKENQDELTKNLNEVADTFGDFGRELLGVDKPERDDSSNDDDD